MEILIRSAAMLLLSSGFVYASTPFAGTWKMNSEKSDLVGSEVSYIANGDGSMTVRAGNMSEKFRFDGKDYSDGLGSFDSWKKTGDHTFETSHKTKGKVYGVDRIHIADDGKTAEDQAEVIDANGKSHTDVYELERESGAQGLEGKWKLAKVKLGELDEFTIADAGPNAIDFSYPSYQLLIKHAVFDGPTYQVNAPTIPQGAAGKIARIDDRSFSETRMVKGKVFWKGTYSVSPDSKHLTVVGGLIDGKQSTMVYDRQ